MVGEFVNNYEIDEIIECLEENLKHERCNEYYKLIDKALVKKNKILVDIIRMINRGDYDDE